MWAKQKQPGFTIVELLIVIVVIGILAAITIVAYNGIQSRAKIAASQSAVASAAKTLEQYKVNNIQANGGELYPTDLTAALATGIKASSGGTYTNYIANNTISPAYYCLTETNGTTSYSVTSTQSTPVEGVCVTNLMQNPSFESNMTSWGGNTSLTSINATTGGTGGALGSKRLTIYRTGTGDAYASYPSSATNAPLNVPISLSFWISGDSSFSLNDTILFRHTITGNQHIIATAPTYAVTAAPKQVTLSGTTNASSSTGPLQIILRLPLANTVNVYYDGFMMTQTAVPYAFADGNTPGWIWNGTVNNSTSTGPALPLS